jgi:hypothetical protein
LLELTFSPPNIYILIINVNIRKIIKINNFDDVKPKLFRIKEKC